jgi:N utilization substance protein A
MAQEIIRVIEQVSREKGIEKGVLIEAVEAAIVSAAKKCYKLEDNVTAHLNWETGVIDLCQVKEVVSSVQLPDIQISLDEAREIEPGVQEGDSLKFNLESLDLGRIAAQTAKQVIVQRVREAEREVIFQEFKKREGELVNGIIRRFERRDIIVDLGRTEAVLPYSEQIPNETYRRGDRVRAVLLEVKKTGRGPQLILSRAHPSFVTRLFELEVPEIYENILEIKSTAREAGRRTKIAVVSHDSKVDAVGTCVGLKGSRVQSIVRELEGEKIDVVRWTNDIREFTLNALSPAQIKSITQTDEGTLEVVVADDQLSLAIGKKGQNARLAAKLIGLRIDIKSESQQKKEQEENKRQKLAETICVIQGVGEKTALDMINEGFTSLKGIAEASAEELSSVPGIGKAKATAIIESAKSALAEAEKGDKN